MSSSPAINAIFDGSAPPFDQRGVSRPIGLRPCIGAFEFGATFAISGRVAIGSGSSPVSGVTILANALSAVTDVNGDYTFSNLLAGSYFIAPQPNSTNTPAGLFSPASYTKTVTTGNVPGVNFTASTNTSAAITPGATSKTNFQASFTGAPNVTYLIQASTNLASPTNWVTLSTSNSGANGSINFTNSITTNIPRRFYRAVAQ